MECSSLEKIKNKPKKYTCEYYKNIANKTNKKKELNKKISNEDIRFCKTRIENEINRQAINGYYEAYIHPSTFHTLIGSKYKNEKEYFDIVYISHAVYFRKHFQEKGFMYEKMNGFILITWK